MQAPSSTPSGPSPLDQLADIHLPETVSWWPLAPGWWLLIALLALGALGLFLWHRRQRQNHYRVIAQQQLAAIYADYQHTQNAAAYLQALSVLLRRTALTAYPQSFNASIKGQAWLQWLDNVCPALTDTFSGELGQSLLSSAYQKNPQLDVRGLHQLSAQWITLHRNHRQKLSTSKKAAPKKVTTMVEAKNV